jgi:hypothetical protein
VSHSSKHLAISASSATPFLTHRHLGIFAKIPSFLLFFPSDVPLVQGFSPAPLHPLADHNLPIRDSTAMARSQELARLFQQPDSTTQRRYEICRAYFLEGATAQQLAQQYQLHVGTVRAIIRDFASDPHISTFFGLYSKEIGPGL